MKRAGPVLAFAAYAIITAIYTHPLLFRATGQIANDRFDPVLNASILWWNATSLPFTRAWWTPPHYYPSEGIAAFTETLVGLLPLSAPLQWLTGDAILAYNLTLLLTWPLSGLAAFLLVLRLTSRNDAAFVAGLVFAFAPYRISQMGHLQVLACFWLPLALLSLHAYLEERRTRWLVMFGVTWLLQSWTNGYFLLFGALLIGAWLLYFCSTRQARSALVPIGVTWIVSSLPLFATLLNYRAVHQAYGLERPYEAILAFSAQPSAWWQTSSLAFFWPRWLATDIDPEKNLFPGLTAVVLVLAASIVGWSATRRPDDRRPGTRTLAAGAAGVIAILCAAVAALTLVQGPWRASWLGVSIRSSTLDRPLIAGAIALLAYVALSAHARRVLARRSPFIFYTLAVVAIAFLSMGPEIRSGRNALLEYAPYSWLLPLPGFSGLRVPPRFWMLGMLCLGVAAGLGFARLTPRASATRVIAFALVSGGILLDGWLREMPTDDPPELWTRVEPRNRDRALLELPLGPDYDAAATFRAVGHRRRVVNGVSGYDPPHYAPLQAALNDRDGSVLTALASLGPIDVVVDTRAEGEWERFVASVAGVKQLQRDGARVLFELPAEPPARTDGPVLITKMLEPSERDAATLDVGTSRLIASVVLVADGQREALRGRLVVEASDDGSAWRDVWSGSTMGAIVVDEMRDPNGRHIALPVNQSSRWIRVRRVDPGSTWPLREIRVHAPDGT